MEKHSAGVLEDVTWQLSEAWPEEAGFAEQWNALAAGQPLPTVFQTFDWLECWWRHFGGGSDLRLVTGSLDGRLVAAAPLAVRGGRGRIVEAVGTAGVPTRGMGLADRFDLLAADGHPGLVDELVRRTLEQLGRFDLLLLRAFPADSQAIELLGQVAGRRRLLCDRRRRSLSPHTRIAGSWEEFLAGRDGRARRQWRNSRKRLEGAGDHAFTRFPDNGQSIDDALAQMFDINRRSYKWSAGSSLFQSPALTSFYEEFFRRAARHDWLSIQFLTLDGRPVAYQTGFRFAGRHLGYDAGYDQAAAELHPGVHLVVESIRQAFAAGAVEYDMMRGEEPYKSRWATDNREEIHFALYPPSLSGRMSFLIHVRGKDRLKQSRLAQGLYRGLERLRRG